MASSVVCPGFRRLEAAIIGHYRVQRGRSARIAGNGAHTMVRLAGRYLQGNPPSTHLAACLIGVVGIIATGIAAFASGIGDAGASDSDAVLVSDPRVVVLKSKRILHLFDGDRLVRTYAIELGTVPDGPKRRKDDKRTPLGRFRIVNKNPDSQYHKFLGIDYPGEDAVQRGLATGVISSGEARAIRRALEYGQCPSWTTGLGGGIGIHGNRIGRDWTGGCIALSDQHVEELFSVLRIGDPVEILP